MRHALASLLVLSACAHSMPAPTPAAPTAKAGVDYAAIVADPDRTPADRALDPGRKPVDFLRFMGVMPGWRTADLGAGGGYTTELLERVGGDKGAVFSQNAPSMEAKMGTKAIDERLARPINRGVTRVDREYEAPFPPEAKDLDLVVMNVIYHDTVWLKVDRDKMNRAVFAALKPGGRYVIIDSSAKDGSGTADAQTLHRIDEKVVRDEVQGAGFTLDTTSDFLRNPADPRDWNSSPRAAGERRGTGDRFALRFVKP